MLNELPETSESVANRMTELKDAHEAQMDKLFAQQAQEYRQDALERYMSNDELVRIAQIKVSRPICNAPSI